MIFDKRYILSVSISVLVLVLDFLLFFSPRTRWFQAIFLIAILIALSPYMINFVNETKKQKEIEIKFLEFVRSVVGTVKSGIPIPKAILRISNHDFGALSPYVKKLAKQIEWGIPTHQALQTFSKDTGNPVIKRSISIVIEAEKSGGNMDDVLEAVTASIVEIKKVKEEQKSGVYSQIVQGYLVFFIFIAIMLLLQLKLLPPLTEVTGITLGGGIGSVVEQGTNVSGSPLGSISGIFLYLILIQGFFVGIMIGKFSEGTIKFGLKHSLILMVIGYILITTVTGV